MSMKMWLIVGMIASVLVGYLRTRRLTGIKKTVVVIIHTVAFIIFLLGFIVVKNQGI